MSDFAKDWAAEYRAKQLKKKEKIEAVLREAERRKQEREQRQIEESRKRRHAGRGDAITGSKLVRDFCVTCGEAIRVVMIGNHQCLECKPSGVPGSVDNTIVKNGMEYDGGNFHSAEW